MYRRGMFQTCLRMCRNHINTLLNYGMKHETVFLLSPVYVTLFDGELLSFFGIIRILHPSWVLLYFKNHEALRISLLTLLLYLMIQCQKKLHSNLVCDSLSLVRYAHDAVFCSENKRDRFDLLILKLIYRTTKLYVDGAL